MIHDVGERQDQKNYTKNLKKQVFYKAVSLLAMIVLLTELMAMTYGRHNNQTNEHFLALM